MIKCVFEDGDVAKPHLRHVVIDALVLKADKILLVKRTKKLLEGGKWGLIGGFMSEGENLKQTLEREIFEETGYRVKDLQLLTIIDNPNRKGEDRQNVSFVFICQAGEKEGSSDWEVTEQKWFSFNNLPKVTEIAFDHFFFIQLYLQYKKEKLTLPILNFK